MDHKHCECENTPNSKYQRRHNQRQKINPKHYEDEHGCTSPKEKMNPHNCPRNKHANHSHTGHSHKERNPPTDYYNYQDPVRKRLSFSTDDVSALVEAVEEINRSSNTGEKEAPYRELQKFIGEIAQTIRNFEPDHHAMQVSSHTFGQNVTNTDYRVNPNIIENIADIENEISDIEDEFNPRWASSRISDTSKRMPKYQGSGNRKPSKKISERLEEFFPLVEGSLYSTLPSRSFKLDEYESPKHAYEDECTRYIDDKHSSRQNKANPSERYEHFSYYTPKINLKCSQNRAPNKSDSYREQILQNIQKEWIERRAGQKANESDPINIRHEHQRKFVNNLQGFEEGEKEPIVNRMECNLGPISEQHKIVNDESNDFVCKTVIIQTVKKYPSFVKGMLQPVSRILTPTGPDTVVYQDTAYGERERDGQKDEDYRKQGEFERMKSSKLEKRQKPGTAHRRDDHEVTKDIPIHKRTKVDYKQKGTKAESIYGETKKQPEDISSEEYFSLLGMDKTPGHKEKAKSDQFMDEIEKSGKDFKSKVMELYPSPTEASLALSTEALEKLGPTDDEEWDEYLALAQTISKEQTIGPKRSVSFHR